jgi:hypothetical protein
MCVCVCGWVGRWVGVRNQWVGAELILFSFFSGELFLISGSVLSFFFQWLGAELHSFFSVLSFFLFSGFVSVER